MAIRSNGDFGEYTSCVHGHCCVLLKKGILIATSAVVVETSDVETPTSAVPKCNNCINLDVAANVNVDVR